MRNWLRWKLPLKIWKYRWIPTAFGFGGMVWTFAQWMGWSNALGPAAGVLMAALLWLATPLGIFSFLAVGILTWFFVTAVQYMRWKRSVATAATAVPPVANNVWRKRERLELYTIAHRSLGLEPAVPVVHPDALERMRQLEDAIVKGRLGADYGDVLANGPSDGVYTKITHPSFLAFAEAVNDDDMIRFARDEWKPPSFATPGLSVGVAPGPVVHLETHVQWEDIVTPDCGFVDIVQIDSPIGCSTVRHYGKPGTPCAFQADGVRRCEVRNYSDKPLFSVSGTLSLSVTIVTGLKPIDSEAHVSIDRVEPGSHSPWTFYIVNKTRDQVMVRPPRELVADLGGGPVTVPLISPSNSAMVFSPAGPKNAKTSRTRT